MFATDRSTAFAGNQPSAHDTAERRTVLLAVAGNEAERLALSAWLNGTRSTPALAESLQISHLAASDQRREVKRFKDRILKRVSRLQTGPV